MIAYLKNTKSILIWLICLTYAGLFFPIRISNIPLIALLLFCALKTNPTEILRTVKENIFSQIILALFFVQIIGLLYTNNFKTAFFLLEKKTHFLLIPLLVLPLLQKAGMNKNLIFKYIGFITLFSSLVLLGIAVSRKFILNNLQAFDYISGSDFEGFTSIHYPYYAMYFAWGSLVLIDCLFDSLIRRKYGFFLIVLLFIYSLSILIIVASKTGIIVFAVASTIFLYFKLADKRIFAISIILLLLAGSVLLYLNESTRERFTGLNENLSILTKDILKEDVPFNGLSLRLLFWKLPVLHLWHDGLILTGVGPGDAQDYIDSIFNHPNYQLYGYIGWDSHNQWVYTLLQLGIIGLLPMALLYVMSFKRAFKRVDTKFISFLIITLVFSLTESILELNKGIVFFALIFTLLSASYREEKSLT